MTPLLAGLAGWLVVSAVAAGVWRARERPRPWRAIASRAAGVIVLVLLGATQLTVAALAAAADPAPPVTAWVGLGAAAVSAVLAGGTAAKVVLDLARADGLTTHTGPGGVLVRRELLRGGAWIGVLERIGVFAALLTWVEGVALVLAIKGLARYPELKAGATSGAAERFIIGTLISFGWAGGCAGIGWLILH
ncbi:MAG TPA: hypothetical protein VK020_03975 [Microlunatus sp.]|nr:hypothetical protein [Microlunatus sp.]